MALSVRTSHFNKLQSTAIALCHYACSSLAGYRYYWSWRRARNESVCCSRYEKLGTMLACHGESLGLLCVVGGLSSERTPASSRSSHPTHSFTLPSHMKVDKSACWQRFGRMPDNCIFSCPYRASVSRARSCRKC
jgi:hypothetical protein